MFSAVVVLLTRLAFMFMFSAASLGIDAGLLRLLLDDDRLCVAQGDVELPQ